MDWALPLLSEAAGQAVTGHVGDANPLCAVQDALNLRGFDEIILSTLPWRVSQWLRVDLPRKIGALGLPVLHVQRAPVAEGGRELGLAPREHGLAPREHGLVPRSEAGVQARAVDDPLPV